MEKHVDGGLAWFKAPDCGSGNHGSESRPSTHNRGCGVKPRYFEVVVG